MSRHSFRRAESHPGHRSVAGGLARASVFGVSDGLVSNVSLVIGFAGAGVASSVVRLAGLAGAIAGATSMAAGEWVSISAQNEMVYRELAVERRELAHNTVSETAELAAMYEGHGMTRQIALDAAADVMREPEAALVVHVREELGVDPNELGSPWTAAGLSLVCFLVGALLPVIPWFAGRRRQQCQGGLDRHRRGCRGAGRRGHRQVRRATHRVERHSPGVDPAGCLRGDVARRPSPRCQRDLTAFRSVARRQPNVVALNTLNVSGATRIGNRVGSEALGTLTNRRDLQDHTLAHDLALVVDAHVLLRQGIDVARAAGPRTSPATVPRTSA